MIYDKILVRYGDLTLKGKNKKIFIDKLYKHIFMSLDDIKENIERRHDLCLINVNNNMDINNIISRLKCIPGLHSYSLVKVSTKEIDDIKNSSLEYFKSIYKQGLSFKVDVKRSDKNYPYDSMEMIKMISSYILQNINNLKVDVKNPDILLKIEIKQSDVYIYKDKEKLMNGFPFSIAGKGLMLLSGGIDSPVSSYLSIKQGIEVEYIHFESTPLTSLESCTKVVDLVKKLSKYYPSQKAIIYFVPFKDIHKEILDKVDESYKITVMRRIMYKISERLAIKTNNLVLINGESVGQVASQTLESMRAVSNFLNIPLLRPLATYDKEDIIKISKKIDTYDISIRPFSDCCTLYVPKAPATKPNLNRTILNETRLNIDERLDDIVDSIIKVVIDDKFESNLSLYGFEFKDVIDNIKNVK